MSEADIEIWGEVSAKEATEATAWLRPFLVGGERIELMFACSSWWPFMSAAVLTNLRIVGVPSGGEGLPKRQVARSTIRDVRSERRKLRHALIVERWGGNEVLFAGVSPDVVAELARRLSHEPPGVGAPEVDPHDLVPMPSARHDVEAMQSIVAFATLTFGLVLVWVSAAGVVVAGVASAILGPIALSCMFDVLGALRYRLTGPMRMSDVEFDALIADVEAAGARSQPDPHEAQGFDLLVQQALDALPEFMRRALDDNLAVVISDEGDDHGAFGLYHGDGIAFDTTADRIVIFRDTLMEIFGDDPHVLREQVRVTVLHELAHHLGADEDRVRDLGL